MAYDHPSIIQHVPFLPPLGQRLDEPAVEPEVLAAASREAAQRDMAMIRDLNGGLSSPKPPPPQLRAPRLPEDFAQHIADLDREIYERGVAIDRDKLLSLGKARFDELLAADRVSRSERVIGTRCDLTSWPSVFYALSQSGALWQIPVPRPKTRDQLQGIGEELDQVRQVEGFIDLWKVFSSEPRAVRAVYAFRDIFESLLFGQSLFTRIEDTGRVHHKFFCGSSGNKVRLFEAWLPALKGLHYRAKITNALQAVVFWLAGEQSPPPDARELAREWFGVRVPSPEQIKFAAAVFDGFLSNRKDWALWEFVGRQIRSLPDRMLLERWTDELRARFRRIDVFHRQVAGFFLKPVGDHHEFEPARHRAFVNRTLDQLLDCISALVALTIHENSPADSAPVAARFRDWILCTGKPNPQLVERITAKLQTAFPGSAFKVE